jgi:hypothetical protein
MLYLQSSISNIKRIEITPDTWPQKFEPQETGLRKTGFQESGLCPICFNRVSKMHVDCHLPNGVIPGHE